MCYDMSFYASLKKIAEYLKRPKPKFTFTPTYHKVAQTYCPWPVITNNDIEQINLLEWGLITDYMNTPEKVKEYRSSMANARVEKMLTDEKSIWNKLQAQRCIVLASGFFEHKEIGKQKQPYYISPIEGNIFTIAGLYHGNTFTVLTRTANTLMQGIHNGGEHAGRMPLILPNNAINSWLQPSLPFEELKLLCNLEATSNSMQAWPVNTIRKSKEDNERVITPVATQQSLF